LRACYWAWRLGCSSRPRAALTAVFLAGQLSEVDFIEAAADPNRGLDPIQHCDAWFYAGSKRLVAGDKSGAGHCFRKCAATNVKALEEYQSAGEELKLSQEPVSEGMGNVKNLR